MLTPRVQIPEQHSAGVTHTDPMPTHTGGLASGEAAANVTKARANTMAYLKNCMVVRLMMKGSASEVDETRHSDLVFYTGLFPETSPILCANRATELELNRMLQH
jgi:hypothetical protein